MRQYHLRFSFLFILFISFCISTSAQIFISPDGDDNNPGTINSPVKSFSIAVNKAQAGDTIYVRGGVYTLSVPINISKDGSAENKYYLIAYNNERPLLDFSSMLFNSGNRGISLSGDYWYIKGLDIKGAGDNGMNISGNNNTVEFCSFFENRDTGLQLSSGASNNQIINCDSYFNADPPDYGDADGFAPKLNVGSGNYFFGCRAWGNCDDGWDGYMREEDDVTTMLEHCWAFGNGYLKDGTDPGSQANGNGFKMGGSDNKQLMHNMTLIYCLAFDNKARGFDQNSNKGNMYLYNTTSFRNGTNYSIATTLNSGKEAVVINGVSFQGNVSFGNFVQQQTNSWASPFVVTAEDFLSIDTAGVRGQRKADGSLPDINFMHLAAGSDLIDAGTNVGLPFAGTAPDLGAFETGLIVPVELSSFTASVDGNSVLLKWSTATEVNNMGFELQRLSIGAVKQYYTIAFIKGAGTSADVNEYIFRDINAPKGNNSYRLKQIDFDGTFTYSEEVQINNALPVRFNLAQNFPNPFNPSTTFSFEVNEPGMIQLEVFDILGRKITDVVNDFYEAGVYEINWIAEDAFGGSLPGGIYLVRLKSETMNKTIKVTLLK